MARYKIEFTRRNNNGKLITQEAGPFNTPECFVLREEMAKWKTIVILRDSEGEDHPENAGKFLLYKIVK